MQPDISPLARRLAEENNVKWQGLYGSGSEGRIVERDVLEYLARVMAGEEDLNPTAEPLPAGMEAWPEEDLAATNLAATNMTATQTAAPTPQVTLTPAKSRDFMANDLLDDDALDLDLAFDDEPTPAASTPGGQNVVLADDAEDIDDDMFLFDDAFDDDLQVVSADTSDETADFALSAEATGADMTQDFGFDTEDSEPAAFELAAETEFDTAFDATTDLQTDSDSDAFGTLADDLQALELAATPAEVQDIALFEESTDTSANAESDVSLFIIDEALSDEAEVEAIGTEDALFEDVTVEDAAVEAVAVEAVVVEDLLVEDLLVEDVAVEALEVEADASEDEAMGLEDATAFSTSAEDETVDADTADAGATAADTETETAYTTDSAEEPNAVAPAYSDVDIASPLATPYENETPYQAPYEAPRAAPSTFATAAANPQFVSYGLLLRRRVDLTKLMEAQVSIGQELGHNGPVAPGSLLLRAAAKALLTLPLNEHNAVGLAVFGDHGVQLAAVDDVTTRPFRDIVAAVAQPQTNSTTAFGVVVADMSDFDIDEAVLNAGAPVLTLGRILHDNTEGSHHSTLALSGEMTVEQGTKFLAAVADLLDAPIRLVI